MKDPNQVIIKCYSLNDFATLVESSNSNINIAIT